MEEKKYKVGRKLITFICDCCGQEATKPESEYKRNIKLGRHNFCSRNCSGRFHKDELVSRTSEWVHSQENKEHLKNACRRVLNPFNYTMSNIRRRFKDVDIDVEYLKQVWEEQKGICPYTGLHLILPTYSNLKEIDVCYRASLDRIDSSKGYVKGNVQFISTPINYLKNTMSDLETKHYLKLISSYTSSFEEEQTISSSLKEMSGT